MEEQDLNKPLKKGRKRTKPAIGLGDAIEKVTKATGIKDAVELFSKATGIDCGCDERKEKLNKLFRGRKPQCLTEDEYEFAKYITNKSTYPPEDQKTMNAILTRVFNQRYEPTGCTSCVLSRVQELRVLLKAYEDNA